MILWRSSVESPRVNHLTMLHPEIIVSHSQIQGTGIFARSFIPKDTIVWELNENEEYLTFEEFQQLPPELQEFPWVYKDKYVNSKDGSQYMNHSCNPNSWWRGDNMLVASRDIYPGEEVTYDYGTTEIDAGYTAEWNCNCGADNCRKIIKPKDCLTLEFQEQYKGHLPSWVEEFIAANADSVLSKVG